MPNDLQRLIDEELYDRDSRWPPRTPAPEGPPSGLDPLWRCLALAAGIPCLFSWADTGAREGRGT